MIVISLTLRTESHDPKDSKESAERFCKWLKDILLAACEGNQVSSTVEYSVSEVEDK